MLNGTIMILITMFLKFHIHLATTNKTTIENLDKKGEDYVSIYDIGAQSNWEQIFGMNKLLWPFPVFCGSGKPLGDESTGQQIKETRPIVRKSVLVPAEVQNKEKTSNQLALLPLLKVSKRCIIILDANNF